MKNNTKEKRNYSLDILRVIAMTMVIVIHVSNAYCRCFEVISHSSYLIALIFNTLSRISVPIFFMISGALLLDRKFNLKKYLKRLLKFVILIVIWDTIYLIFEYLFWGTTYDDLYRLIFDPYRAHLWFLYSILIIYALQPIVRIILNKSNKFIKISLLCIWVLLSGFSLINPFIAEHCSDIFYLGYFVLGKYLYDFAKNNDLRKYNILFIFLMVISIGTSVILNYSLSMKYQMFYNTYFAYRTIFIMIASIIFYLLVISNYKKDSLNKNLLILSELSLGVYLIHGIFLDITIKLFNYPSIYSLIGIPLFTIIIFICSTTIIYLLRKAKFLKALF